MKKLYHCKCDRFFTPCGECPAARTTYQTHCIFCSKNFPYELRPVLGFATARACSACQEIFARQWAERVQESVREYEQAKTA